MDYELEAIQRWEPNTKALVGWDPIEACKRLANSISGPLSGWSIGVKDIIDVQGMPTLCNASFVSREPVTHDAEIVKKLLSQGAFVLSKTVTTPFAFLDPGITCNPWNFEHTPGGSSSGSAAAVACGMVRLALGSQTVASVIRPASYCGVVGFKPTFERFSTAGIFPFSPAVDTVGFFTRSVSDMQIVMEALTKESVKQVGNRIIKLGLVSDIAAKPAGEEMLNVLNNSVSSLDGQSFKVEPVTVPEGSSEAYSYHFDLISAEAFQVHEKFFSRYRDRYPPNLRQLLLKGKTISSQEIEQIREHKSLFRKRLLGLFEEYDVLVTPSASGAAPRGLGKTGDPRFSLLWTYTGCPSLTLPVALSSGGLPMGLQLIGRPMEDTTLLSISKMIETFLPFSSLVG